MYENETVGADCDDYERFIKAFYLFLEQNACPSHEAAWLQTGGGGAPPTAVLWSREAADQFRTFLSNFKLDRERPQSLKRFDSPRP